MAEFSFKALLPDVAGSAEWGMARGLIDNAGNVIKAGRIKLGLDTLAPAMP